MAVRGNEIVYVGNNEGAQTFIGDKTETADFDGRLLPPGFVESHIHLALGGATTSGIILDATDSLDDVLRKVKEYADDHPEKETIFGASYFAAYSMREAPTRPCWMRWHLIGRFT